MGWTCTIGMNEYYTVCHKFPCLFLLFRNRATTSLRQWHLAEAFKMPLIKLKLSNCLRGKHLVEKRQNEPLSAGEC
ncbi:hypothetical protein, partial [Crocosphaera sp. Alani8]|uniref:hypothetical protein n=1 Tax=Crocosphaera sp. Alani8 TaxID=3038952 RepID=UPI00313DCFBE